MSSLSPTLTALRQALEAAPAKPPETATADPVQAAVALVLRDTKGGPELLFIQRAEHPLDPWSGHMAFPGGRVDAEDQSPLAAACRETQEEVALDLGHSATLIGHLSLVPIVARGQRLRMTIAPFVFELSAEPRFTLNEEVDAVHWVSLARLANPEERTPFLYHRNEVSLSLPSLLLGTKRIWGLTLGMADDLLGRVGAAPGLPRHPAIRTKTPPASDARGG